MASTSKATDIREEKRPLLRPSHGASSSGAIPRQGPSVPKQKQSSVSRQVFFGIIVALPSVPFGMSLGFSAIALEELIFTVDEASWFASATPLAYPLGALIVGPMMDKYGRRPALLSINLVSFFGWLLLSVPAGSHILKLISGRLLTGLAGGLASVPASVYAAECLSSDLTTRSSIAAWSTVALSAGICLVYTTGSFLEYYAVASIATLISVVSFVLVAIFLPESPVWYSMKGRHGDAEWSLREIDINPPLPPPEQPSEVEEPGRQPPPPPPPPQPEKFKELMKPEAYKPLLIMIGFFFFQQFSGVFVIIAYLVDIIRAAGVTTTNILSIVTVLAGTIILLVSLVASLVYPKTGVRAIAIVSGVGTTVTTLFLAIFLSLRVYWISRASFGFLNWLPVLAILSNISVSAVGFLILPWSMLGEVFPNSVKGLAASIATCLGFTFSFIAAKIYPFIQLGLGVEGVFFTFAAMALLGTIFVIVFLPETRGKTLEEILQEFSKPKTPPVRK